MGCAAWCHFLLSAIFFYINSNVLFEKFKPPRRKLLLVKVFELSVRENDSLIDKHIVKQIRRLCVKLKIVVIYDCYSNNMSRKFITNIGYWQRRSQDLFFVTET